MEINWVQVGTGGAEFLGGAIGAIGGAGWIASTGGWGSLLGGSAAMSWGTYEAMKGGLNKYNGFMGQEEMPGFCEGVGYVGWGPSGAEKGKLIDNGLDAITAFPTKIPKTIPEAAANITDAIDVIDNFLN